MRHIPDGASASAYYSGIDAAAQVRTKRRQKIKRSFLGNIEDVEGNNFFPTMMVYGMPFNDYSLPLIDCLFQSVLPLGNLDYSLRSHTLFPLIERRQPEPPIVPPHFSYPNTIVTKLGFRHLSLFIQIFHEGGLSSDSIERFHFISLPPTRPLQTFPGHSTAPEPLNRNPSYFNSSKLFRYEDLNLSNTSKCGYQEAHTTEKTAPHYCELLIFICSCAWKTTVFRSNWQAEYQQKYRLPTEFGC